MNINGNGFVSAATRTQMVKDQLADAGKRFQLNGCPTKTNDNHRDGHGRFTEGCRGGPGRPRKVPPRRFIAPLLLYQRLVDRLDSVNAWKAIADRLGIAGARELLFDLEAECGQVCFRDVALKVIAAGPETPEQECSDGPEGDAKRARRKKHRARRSRISKK